MAFNTTCPVCKRPDIETEDVRGAPSNATTERRKRFAKHRDANGAHCSASGKTLYEACRNPDVVVEVITRPKELQSAVQ